jgi:hypothetical protein
MVKIHDIHDKIHSIHGEIQSIHRTIPNFDLHSRYSTGLHSALNNIQSRYVQVNGTSCRVQRITISLTLVRFVLLKQSRNVMFHVSVNI